LLKRQPWGYLLASVAVMKMLTMGIAVTGMGINMSLNGVPESPIIVIIFGLLAFINLVLGINLLKSVQQKDQYYAAV
jgi:Zn-dependent protease